MPDADTVLSSNDASFIQEALSSQLRLDGRGLYDFRGVQYQFSLDDSSATVTMGSTRVTAVITATLEAPYPDRPSEGSVRFNVECSPMASPAFDAGRPGPLAVQLARLVERALKQSGALDCEALCVIAGRKVWSLRCDVHVLDHGGNLVDACILAALAALLVYRKPEVAVGGSSGTEIIVHSTDQREPAPLTIHHTPVAVTWALFQSPAGVVCLADPDRREQAAQAGDVTIVVNTSSEVCGFHKAGGLGLTSEETSRLIRLSCNHASAVVAELRGALKRHSVERISARVRRHSLRPALTASLPRNISVAHTGAGDGESDESAASDSGDEMEQDSAELKQQPVSIKKEPSSSPQDSRPPQSKAEVQRALQPGPLHSQPAKLLDVTRMQQSLGDGLGRIAAAIAGEPSGEGTDLQAAKKRRKGRR